MLGKCSAVFCRTAEVFYSDYLQSKCKIKALAIFARPAAE